MAPCNAIALIRAGAASEDLRTIAREVGRAIARTGARIARFGEAGTLSALALALKIRRPVVALGASH